MVPGLLKLQTRRNILKLKWGGSHCRYAQRAPAPPDSSAPPALTTPSLPTPGLPTAQKRAPEQGAKHTLSSTSRAGWYDFLAEQRATKKWVVTASQRGKPGPIRSHPQRPPGTAPPSPPSHLPRPRQDEPGSDSKKPSFFFFFFKSRK